MTSLLKSLALSVIFAAALCSCSTPILKAPPAELSAFLAKTPALTPDRKLTPFAFTGGELVSQHRCIYIAPATLDYLRKPSKFLATQLVNEARREKASHELAEYAKVQFTAAFKKSAHPRYVVQDKPDSHCLKLELAVTELNHNTFPGTFSRMVINALALPGTDAILAAPMRPLKGNIAIEGKISDLATGKVIYQFADNQESKSAVVFPLTDFFDYGQAREAIRDWAKEFEQLTRTAPGQKVDGVSVLSLF